MIGHRRASHRVFASPRDPVGDSGGGIPEGTGLTDQAAGASPASSPAEEAHQRWEAAMMSEIERLGGEIRRSDPVSVAGCVEGVWHDAAVELAYWGKPVRIAWEDLVPRDEDGRPLAAFDRAMLLFHLRQSDGTPPAGRWISYRELPGGEFYHQAYLGYTGRRLAESFGAEPGRFDAAASSGERLAEPAPHSWRFRPLPRVPLAACLWPGDDEMPAQASVLFDAHAAHHLPVDALALLGAGLTGRLLRAAMRPPRGEGAGSP